MIGILGGSFDPIHKGHIHIASQVLLRLKLEQIQFMPCALPVHRNQPQALAMHRCAMIELNIADHQDFVLNTLELDRGGPSYSVDSLREIHHQNDAALVLVLGSDAFNDFASWKLPQEILSLAHLAVCHRPGAEPTTELFSDHYVDSIDELHRRPSGAIMMLEVDANECSSTQVRDTLAAGEIPLQCISPEVGSYIEKHQLYRRPGD